jgi:hypothetical protein
VEDSVTFSPFEDTCSESVALSFHFKEANIVMKNTATKKRLANQSLPPLPYGLTVCLAVRAILQQKDETMNANATNIRTVLIWCVPMVSSYLYTDYWLWLLHCFLDREENQTSKISMIKTMAIDFQKHHDKPADLLQGNHLADTGDLITLTAGMGLLLGAWTSAATKLTVLGIILWGAVGGLNHFYCHAITHGYDVPWQFQWGQALGMLPTAQQHKSHHTAPFQSNWNFLNGFHRVYEAAYFLTGTSYAVLYIMFATFNPMAFQAWAFAAGILT